MSTENNGNTLSGRNTARIPANKFLDKWGATKRRPSGMVIKLKT